MPLLDSLRLTLPTVAGEIRLSDFVLLEALRVTEPRVYEIVLGGRKLLLGRGQGAEVVLTQGSRDRQEYVNQATATLVDDACEATERKELGDIIRRILEELFPRVGTLTVVPTLYVREDLDLWRAERRVCIEEYFETATRWGLMPGAISDYEVRNLVNIIDPTVLRERLHAYDHDPRDGVDFAAVVTKIGPIYRAEADAPALEAIVRVMLSEERSDNSFTSIVLLARDALMRLPPSGTRKRVLLDAIREYHVLPVTIRLLRALGKEHGWPEGEVRLEKDRQLSPTDFREVTNAAVADIINQTSVDQPSESTLFTRDFVAGYLYYWRDAAGSDQPKQFLRQTLARRNGFIRLLNSLIGEEAAQRLRSGETISNPPIVRSRLHIMWDFEVADEARATADKLLTENILDAERNLIEWFIDAHQQVNTSATDL